MDPKEKTQELPIRSDSDDAAEETLVADDSANESERDLEEDED